MSPRDARSGRPLAVAAVVNVGLALRETDFGSFPEGGFGKLWGAFTYTDLPDRRKSKGIWKRKKKSAEGKHQGNMMHLVLLKTV